MFSSVMNFLIFYIAMICLKIKISCANLEEKCKHEKSPADIEKKISGLYNVFSKAHKFKSIKNPIMNYTLNTHLIETSRNESNLKFLLGYEDEFVEILYENGLDENYLNLTIFLILSIVENAIKKNKILSNSCLKANIMKNIYESMYKSKLYFVEHQNIKFDESYFDSSLNQECKDVKVCIELWIHFPDNTIFVNIFYRFKSTNLKYSQCYLELQKCIKNQILSEFLVNYKKNSFDGLFTDQIINFTSFNKYKHSEFESNPCNKSYNQIIINVVSDLVQDGIEKIHIDQNAL